MVRSAPGRGQGRDAGLDEVPDHEGVRRCRIISASAMPRGRCGAYENAFSEFKKSYSKLPNSRDILSELDKLQEKKNTLMQEHSSSKTTMDELYKIRKNYGIYMGKEIER